MSAMTLRFLTENSQLDNNIIHQGEENLKREIFWGNVIKQVHVCRQVVMCSWQLTLCICS